MIKLTDRLDTEMLQCESSAEALKILCLYNSYKDDKDTHFWVQDENKAVLSLQDGAMVIYNICADTAEIEEFLRVISPTSVFSDEKTIKALFSDNYFIVNTVSKLCCETTTRKSDTLKSDEIYKILNIAELALPKYEYFATDFCRRLNGGFSEYFAIADKCAAIAFKCDKALLLNGIASRQKGYGSMAVRSIEANNPGKPLLAVCRDEVLGFYQKNGFKLLYKSGYWEKK